MTCVCTSQFLFDIPGNMVLEDIPIPAISRAKEADVDWMALEYSQGSSDLDESAIGAPVSYDFLHAHSGCTHLLREFNQRFGLRRRHILTGRSEPHASRAFLILPRYP